MATRAADDRHICHQALTKTPPDPLPGTLELLILKSLVSARL
jgi:hypothetical protein